MNTIKTVTCLLVLLGLGLIELQAQTSMNVKETSGTQTSVALSGIRKLTFPTGNMVVSKNDGNTSTYALSAVRYFNFGNIAVDVAMVSSTETEEITLFPNPVVNLLQLNIQGANDGELQIDIVDVQGRVVYKQVQAIQRGSNFLSVDVAQLPKGLYVCRMLNNKQLETKKFIKN